MNRTRMNFTNRGFRVSLMLFCLAAAAQVSAQAPTAPDFKAMLAVIDERSNFKTLDISSKVKLVTEEPQKAIDTKVVQSLRRDRDDKFLMLFLEPTSQLGQGYLRIDDNLWIYDPESRKFTHSSMKENFSGSGAKNSDFGQSTLAADYAVSASTDGKLGSYEVWILELTATSNEVTYPSRKIWVTKNDSLLLKSEDYSLTKRLLRTVYYTSYAKVGSSFIADKIIFVDALVAGKKTTVSQSEISLNAIPDSVFSKAYVEKVNR